MDTQDETQWLQQARGGDLDALESLLASVQAKVYNLALRMLGHREDAQDATQEILLKVTTHLSAFRGESAFSTWVYRIASNHLLTARMRSQEFPHIDFDRFSDQLERGLAYAARIGWGPERIAQPEEKLEARRLALTCTQAMLLCLDREQRLAYVLDVVFGLESGSAGEVQGISAAAHRKRLSRARQAMQTFMESRCAMVGAQATCHCNLQVPATLEGRRRGRIGGLQVSDEELALAERGLRELTQMSDAAAVIRGAPEYAAPPSMLRGIRVVVERSALLKH